MIVPSRKPLVLLMAAGALISLSLAPVASAHGGVEVGEYIVELGWREEPAFVGQPNAVQVVVRHHADESPVLRDVDLEVVVETAGESTASLVLAPAFDAAERTGALGEFAVALIPTAPGDYTFHVRGTIAHTEVDLSMTSGEETFDAVDGSSEAEFPVPLPNLAEVATRLDRIDSRIAALQATDSGTDALDAAKAAADAARAAAAAADRALLVGAALGVAGMVAGLTGVLLALRAGRRGSTTA